MGRFQGIGRHCMRDCARERQAGMPMPPVLTNPDVCAFTDPTRWPDRYRPHATLGDRLPPRRMSVDPDFLEFYDQPRQAGGVPRDLRRGVGPAGGEVAWPLHAAAVMFDA